MKKLLFTIIAISFATTSILAQDVPDPKGVRFGVFVRGTPSWYSTPSSSYYSKGGAVFGTGFGLNLEFRITDVVAFQTGVGGDFDGGKINYTHNVGNFNSANDIYTSYILDKTPQLVEIKDKNVSDFMGANSSQYSGHDLLTRRIHTTYVTIPLLLKMMTKEISGFKYFVNFGGTMGVLVGAKSDDYTEENVGFTQTFTNNKGLNMYKDCIPVRIGLNLGLGAEYRIAGTTSLYLSANFVNSFIPTVKAHSVYNFNNVDFSGNTNGTFIYAPQKLNPMGIQINLGVLF